MKKQLIAVGLAGLLTIPAVSFGAEMAGPSLYGSFRTGLLVTAILMLVTSYLVGESKDRTKSPKD